jgi:two-component system chemotaxis response regulator CheY
MTAPGAGERVVLIVDDDPDIRESLEILLGLNGHGVVGVRDGLEALAWLRELRARRPCLILLDLMMPRMNGVELRQALAADPELSRIPVVVITGGGAYADAKTSELGTEVLRKPFDLGALLSTVRRFCPQET